MRLVVGGYSTILTQEALQPFLTSFEVGIFRSDRGQFYALAEQISLAFQRRQIAIQRGRASCRFTLFSCICCGNYLFVDQEGIGQNRCSTPDDEDARMHICMFFIGQRARLIRRSATKSDRTISMTKWCIVALVFATFKK